ncbi:MAG: DUF4956 domain-containing protein [Lachnospiraceae bacterium]|nr:DUF4956 domain-containing protein [Lachnospiraceae bacterium]
MNMEKILETILSTGEMPLANTVMAMGLAFIIGVFIYVVYVLSAKSYFFSKSYCLTLALMPLIITAIILALRSSLVISLGMVGALSIVRFRTAIKEPLDLLFLFWAVSEGIICGAGLVGLGAILCIVISIGLLLFEILPTRKTPYILVINSKNKDADKTVEEIVKANTKKYIIKSKNYTKRGLDMIIEFRAKDQNKVLDELKNVEILDNVSIMEYDGIVRY